jgi:hypothetical protein
MRAFWPPRQVQVSSPECGDQPGSVGWEEQVGQGVGSRPHVTGPPVEAQSRVSTAGALAVVVTGSA